MHCFCGLHHRHLCVNMELNCSRIPVIRSEDLSFVIGQLEPFPGLDLPLLFVMPFTQIPNKEPI